MKNTSRQQGFTLVELSIVLVVVGLITGGVLMGNHLLTQAAVRSTIGQITDFRDAIGVFRQKYQCIPGDCYNATRFFGTVAPNGVSNGDGDGRVEDTSTGGTIEEVDEVSRHLGKSGLLAGNYRGVADLEGTSLQYYPSTKLRNGFITLYYNHLRYCSPCKSSNVMYVGSDLSAAPGIAGQLFTPEEAFIIDQKIDDGIPSTGNLASFAPGALAYTTCTTTDPAGGVSTGAYALDSTQVACLMRLRTGY